MTLAAFFMMAGALTMLSALSAEDRLLFVGNTAGAVALVASGAIMLEVAGIRRTRISLSLLELETGEARKEVVIAHGTFSALQVVVLATATYLISAAIVRYQGGPESLLPVSRESAAGGMIAAILGSIALCGFLGLFLFRASPTLAFSREGIRRHVRLQLGWRVRREELFIRWEDIFAVTPELHVPGTMPLPCIRLEAKGLDPHRRLVLGESATRAQLPLWGLSAEPNAIIALVRWCAHNEWARDRLDDPDACTLLKSPSVLQRSRIQRSNEDMS